MTTTRRSGRAAATALGALIALAPAAPALAHADVVRVQGELVRYSALVPEGATARVQSVADGAGHTHVTLHVEGLLPDTDYGAHAHVNACGATGAAAGPHYQHVPDPVTPSADPAYANPENEIWLDLHTDGTGAGEATTVVDWQFGDRRPHSVIIHREHTHTGPTDSGTAGTRLACISVPF